MVLYPCQIAGTAHRCQCCIAADNLTLGLQEHVEEDEGEEPQVLLDRPEPPTDASSDSGRWDWDKILKQ